jgi:hypothetical protein
MSLPSVSTGYRRRLDLELLAQTRELGAATTA